MLTIELVNVDGMLVGRRYQDRYNLAMLEVGGIEATRNGASLKKLRRMHGDFTFTTIRNGCVAPITTVEANMVRGVHAIAA
jgi:hypothetical protein